MASHPYPHPHFHGAQYASPVIREPSPASTVGSSHGSQIDDKTSASDTELAIGLKDFQRKWADKIGIHDMSDPEMKANESPLLPYTIPEDETLALAQHEERVRLLRRIIQEQEEDDVFEQRLLLGSQVGMEKLPSSNDIDTIIHNMMITDPEHISVSHENQNILTDKLTNPISYSTSSGTEYEKPMLLKFQ